MLKRQLSKPNLLAFLLILSLVFGAFISAQHKISHLQEVSIAKTFTKNSAPIKNHPTSDCALCFTSNIFSNFTLISLSAFFVAQIYLFLIWRDFDSVKLSYLRSTNTSRAPPAIS